MAYYFVILAHGGSNILLKEKKMFRQMLRKDNKLQINLFLPELDTCLIVRGLLKAPLAQLFQVH